MPNEQYILLNVVIEKDGNITCEKALKWITNDGKFYKRDWYSFREIWELDPNGTFAYTSEELKEMGLVGLYVSL